MSDIQEKLGGVLDDWAHILEYEFPSESTPEKFREMLAAQGLAIVPLEPTEEMLWASVACLGWDHHPGDVLMIGAYKAMILNQDPKPR